jgi:hypothetical protein
MKHLVVVGLLAAVGSAEAVVLFNNGPVALGGPPPISVIRAGGTLFGAGQQANIPNLVGDNFSVGGLGWDVQSLTFYGYQSFAAQAFTFTSATWSIVSGDVNTGTVVASGTGASVTNGGLAGFRVTPTTLTNTDRAIFAVNVDIPDVTLAPGSYWLRWGLTGTLASGPWQPPTADGVVGNAVQSLQNAAFVPVLDAGDQLGVELPFTINGVAVVPEPGTYAMMLAGLAALASVARRRAR